jgi:hypothetical protein
MSLSDFRIGAAPLVPEEEVAFEDEPVFQASGTVVCFDQSIANTGWVYVTSGPEGVLLRDCGSIPILPEGYPRGHEGTLMRGDVLGSKIERILNTIPGDVHVLHETPPIATGKMSRPESSLVAAAVIRQVARRLGLPVSMVANQHSKKVLVGNGNADKKQWHKALDRLPWSSHVGAKPTNEGQRDAFCLALTYLLEKR